MRIAIARLLDKIPTVMNIIENNTEIFLCALQVVFPNPSSTGDFDLFIVGKVAGALNTFQQSYNQKASVIFKRKTL